MSEYVKVKKVDLTRLITASQEAHSLLDDVHCYDTEVYEELGEALTSIEYKDIN